ncbi:Putative cyclase [Colwellia chukchiensis]|uniref:Putative cyclase n=1 Tax=Colwellia chukchiensis TaxID=641665 RepID=A0A1H7GH27_9GAMM|nr:cyclase family protein [Colwellia chukchiensis]SEK37384.1 Putative cyclase [Colwellia chukchiensis]
MKIAISLAEHNYIINTEQGHSLAIPLDFLHAHNQPSHFGATPALASAMQAGDFIGDTRKGGSCNVLELSINPHCHGTHTETIAHICHTDHPLSIAVSALALPPLIPCTLITLSPITASCTQDHYRPSLEANDRVIGRRQLEQQLAPYTKHQLQALVVRTLPNNADKCHQHYNDEKQPAFFTADAVCYLNERGVEHLLLDLPSLDRANDQGLLTCHRLFWQVSAGSHQASPTSLVNKTITEMAYIDNSLSDGFYFLNLQTPAFITDAAPSRPVLYQALRVNESHGQQ